MSLYLERPHGATAPQLHALVIGVGLYPFLGDIRDPRLPRLSSLSSPPISARALVEWLEKDYRNPACPLGTIELLLDPAATVTNAEGREVSVAPAAMANIRVAFDAWFRRCNQNPQNIAFFYFAGHGVMRIDRFLLASDFGDPAHLARWRDSINFTRMLSGMDSCRAQRQFYFIDACQDTPDEVLLHESPQGDSLVDATLDQRVASKSAYYAAPAKYPAFAPPGQPTFFCQALLQCLGGAAAYRTRGHWIVDSASLANALVRIMNNLAVLHREEIRPETDVSSPVPLHHPVDGSVMLLVDCRPVTRRWEVAIDVRHAGGAQASSPAGHSRPWTHTLPPGAIDIALSTASSECKHSDVIAPPTYEWEGEL